MLIKSTLTHTHPYAENILYFDFELFCTFARVGNNLQELITFRIAQKITETDIIDD